MNVWAYAVIALAAALLALVVTFAVLSARVRRQQAEAVSGLTEQLTAARAELMRLGDRIDGLANQGEPSDAYVITGVVAAASDDAGGESALSPEARFVNAVETARPTWVPARPVRETLIRGVAFGHGLRRALSADTRDRMVLEFRAELRRSRRQRKAEIKAARKYLRQQRDSDQRSSDRGAA
ncbi:MAG: hypothetical protein QM655_00780 [Nocardioidaceae bacterium]